MPRKARIDAPGALHHIIVRGIERRTIFRDDADRYDFIERLGLIVEQTGTECLAWALIPNHFHLLLRTGSFPIAHAMRRLLTGHAIYFNRRHHRHGHLFQNRYKSILCQDDAYLLELVRYIHLNPLRAKQVKDMSDLGKYPFSGHGVIMGKYDRPWQGVKPILAYFGKQLGPSRRNYRSFVAKGIAEGRRSDLVGGGLVRSSGGWAAVKALRATKAHMKSDERILGDSEFVTAMLEKNDEAFDSTYELQAKGVDLDFIAKRVAQLLKIEPDELWQPGRYQRLVVARNLLCFWAVHELGISLTELARRLGISVPGVGYSVVRGKKIVRENGYKLIE